MNLSWLIYDIYASLGWDVITYFIIAITLVVAYFVRDKQRKKNPQKALGTKEIKIPGKHSAKVGNLLAYYNLYVLAIFGGGYLFARLLAGFLFMAPATESDFEYLKNKGIVKICAVTVDEHYANHKKAPKEFIRANITVGLSVCYLTYKNGVTSVAKRDKP